MKNIHVSAAAILRGNEVFVTERGYGEFKDQWEFPGGKLEAGETPEEALVREIEEEFATEVNPLAHLATIEHDYPAFHLTMELFACEVVEGRLDLLEAEAAKWVHASELDDVPFLPADKKGIPALKNFLAKRG